MKIFAAMSVLGLDEEFTQRDLRKAYRIMSMQFHPDRGGTSEQFETLTKAYGALKSRALKDGVKSDEQTVEGVPIEELGKGYPLTVSAVECDVCKGKGWKGYAEIKEVEVVCPKCCGEGTHWYECENCGGTGDYITPHTNTITGRCYKCDGTGRFYPKYRRNTLFDRFFKVVMIKDKPIQVNICLNCNGTGKTKVKKRLDNAMKCKCQECDGIGEVKIYNPVLPRGYLIGKEK